MFSNRLYSPLRYPGGKASFAPFIAGVMEANGLSKGHYLEPYAGGAGVALELLFHGHAAHIHINDIDPAVHAFWVSVVSHSEELLELLNATPINMDEWFKWRCVLREEISATIVEKGFAALFMNRTNRSGILKAGVIGGKSQAGVYKLNARFDKDKISERILKIAERAENITVYCEDSLELLRRCEEFLPDRSLIYLDPPYYVKGKGLYRNYYKHDDHLMIAETLKNYKFPWVVSYDNAEEICEMYQLSKSLTYGLNYTAQRRYVGNEIMFFSHNLIVPNMKIPQTKLVS
ncbi:DNA adenine methylase [Cellvibrio fontiphilus]|uniref:site-specific DNA-methyltransferase (adenine-specific) n=1 Tax=Cellvibrio fontiphilus TaxID=1815559 RepID=A0ABV7FL90_9GAMM